jgi:hypothetical protein
VLKHTVCAVAFLALAACSGGGAQAPVRDTSGAHSCPALAFPIVNDPMIDPPAGATGVSSALDHVTVPDVPGLAGLTLFLVPAGSGPATQAVVQGSIFGGSGPGTLRAALPASPPLAAKTTYFAQASQPAGTGPLGCPLVQMFALGSFTTQ